MKKISGVTFVYFSFYQTINKTFCVRTQNVFGNMITVGWRMDGWMYN
jgi:hypothetical protein